MASVPLPNAVKNELPRLPFNKYPLQDALRKRFQIEVPIISWPKPPHQWPRISQRYNSLPQYERLVGALVKELKAR